MVALACCADTGQGVIADAVSRTREIRYRALEAWPSSAETMVEVERLWDAPSGIEALAVDSAVRWDESGLKLVSEVENEDNDTRHVGEQYPPPPHLLTWRRIITLHSAISPIIHRRSPLLVALDRPAVRLELRVRRLGRWFGRRPWGTLPALPVDV